VFIVLVDERGGKEYEKEGEGVNARMG